MRLKEQLQKGETWVFLICAFSLGMYCFDKFDVSNLVKWDSSTPVHMGGSVGDTTQLKEVSVLNIPDEVYQSLNGDSHFKRYLTGNHKYILLWTFSAPYYRPYTEAFERTFPLFSAYYRKRVEAEMGPAGVMVGCGQRASQWLLKNCFEHVCILNPQRKQVVVDKSKDARQLPILLEAYKEW